MTALVLVAVFAVIITGAWWTMRRQPSTDGTEIRKRDLKSIRGSTPQQICERAAAVGNLHVVLVEESGPTLRTVAGAPWMARFDILDELAIRDCLKTGEPTGMGAGHHGASDWTFVPVQRQGSTVAVVGLAGLHCRRRLQTDEPLTLAIQQAFTRCLAKPSQPSPVATAPMTTATAIDAREVRAV